jgi:hypothetical protein
MRRNAHLVVAAAEPAGVVDTVAELTRAAEERQAGAIALLGDLAGAAGPERFVTLFTAINTSRRPVFWVPGPHDAPVAEYLRAAHGVEAVKPWLHGVHGTAVLSPDYVVFAGMGGDVIDDPGAGREEIHLLRYPGWEVEYRLKVLRELPRDYPVVLLFTTAPAHKGLGRPGSQVLADLINTYRPKVVLIAGGQAGQTETLGTSLMVHVGSLQRKEHVTVNIATREVWSGCIPAG